MKRNIAIVAGGYSGEYVISEKSARMIKKNIDPELFNSWVIYIVQGQWFCRKEDGTTLPVDKNDFSIIDKDEKVLFDCAFITIHGTPGEDGKLQGYFELLGIPYTTAGLLPSALTFNKFFCKIIVTHLGVHVARSVKLRRGDEVSEHLLESQLQLPVFVKPNKGGSSLGTSFVQESKHLIPSVLSAFEHDDEVLVEEYIEGIELTCGVFKNKGMTQVLPVTLVRSKSGAGFFDFTAKYTKEASEEITPAPIDDALTREIQETTRMLYEAFEMKGMARIDYIYGNDRLSFLEINVTPGMSETSIVPQQAAIEGISVRELFTMVIVDAMK